MLTENQKCPVCSDGVLSKVYTPRDIVYKTAKRTFHGYEFFCSSCGESFLTPDLEEVYEDDLVCFFRDVDGLLHPKKIREIRKSFNLTQREFALKLGVGEKNFARYENGTVTQGRSMDILLRVFQEYPEAFYRVVEKKNEAGESTAVDKKVLKISQQQADVSWAPRPLSGEATEKWERYDAQIEMEVKRVGDSGCSPATSTVAVDENSDWQIASGGCF